MAVALLKGSNILVALPTIAPIVLLMLFKIHLRYDFRNMSPIGKRRVSLDDCFDWGNDIADGSIWDDLSDDAKSTSAAPNFEAFSANAMIRPMLSESSAEDFASLPDLEKSDKSRLKRIKYMLKRLKPACVNLEVDRKAEHLPEWEMIPFDDVLNDSRNMWRARSG